MSHGDAVLGKIVLDFSQKYVSIFLCEGDGSVKDADHFKWPARLDTKETRHEVRDTFDFLYDFVNETVNGPADDELQGIDEEEPD